MSSITALQESLDRYRAHGLDMALRIEASLARLRAAEALLAAPVQHAGWTEAPRRSAG